MTDESRFRPLRGQEYSQPHQSGAVARARRGEDPLAELARLIGQEDPFAGFVPYNRNTDYNVDSRTRGNGDQSRQAYGYDGRAEGRRRAAEPVRRQETDNHETYDPRYAEETPRGNGRGAYAYRGNRDTYEDAQEQEARPAPARSNRDRAGYAPAFTERTQAPHARDPQVPYARDQEAYSEQDQEAYADPRLARRVPAEPAYDGGGYDQYRDAQYDPQYANDGYLPAHGDEVYEDAPRGSRRRWLTLAAVAVGVILLAGSGVFAYRALFGTKIGAQPRTIKSESGPSKIMPGSASQSADASNQKKILDRVGGDRPGTGERIVSREEEPITTSSRNPGARTPSQGGPVAVAGPQVVASTSSPAAAASSEPRRVRTLSVRSDGSVIGDQPAARGAATGSTQRNAPPAASPGSGSNQPLTLNTYAPQSGQAAAVPEPPSAPSANPGRISSTPARNENPWADIPANAQPAPTRTATVSPAQSASPAPAAPRAPPPTVAVQTPPPAGSYVVQVSSRKSEAEAQADWQQLQARYATVLGGRQATIRRADLGERGTFYRAQLGPFSTRAQASELCQSLKSAGGECVIQRN
jgi:hypothetical protein